MSKKQTKKKVVKRAPEIEVLNAHAGQFGQHMGTYVTYKQSGGTCQAFFCWADSSVTPVIVDIERKLYAIQN